MPIAHDSHAIRSLTGGRAPARRRIAAVSAFAAAVMVAALAVPAQAADDTTPETATSATDAVSSTPVPMLSGRVAVGSAVTAETAGWPEGTTFTYSWRILSSTGSEFISKTAGETYIPTGSNYGKKLSVVVTATAPEESPVSVQSAWSSILKGTFVTTPTPTIAGTAAVGATLTATPGEWSPAATLTYSWRRDGTKIPGATSASYTLVTADAGTKITVGVSGARTGYGTRTRLSEPTSTILRSFTKSYFPTISGTARSGQTLTANVAAWSPTATFSFQWRRNGEPIVNATAKTYPLTSTDVGSTITVTVTGKRSGYLTKARTSAATATVGTPVTLTTSGMFEVGVDITPGTYASSNKGSACTFERRSDDSRDLEGRLGYNYNRAYGYDGQKIVTIAATDAFFYTEGCGTWTRTVDVKTPRTTIGDGTYVLGRQITAGLWRADGPFPTGCYFDVLRSFTGDEIADIIYWTTADSGPITIRIPTTRDGSTVKGFTTEGCGTWRRVGD